MKFADHLNAAEIQKFNQMGRAGRNTDKNKDNKDEVKPKRKRPENLSFRDIESLRGVNKSVYTRKNGAIRRK